MFPFMFFGGFLASWFESFWSSPVQGNANNNTMKYSEGSYVDDLLLQVLRINEGAGSQAVEKAYPLRGETGFTIGYGNKWLYTRTGANFRGNGRVIGTDTLTSLKGPMGYASLSSEMFARQLIENHIKFDYNFNRGGAKNFFAKLDAYKIPYSRSVNVGLIDIGYMSGSFFSSAKGNDFMLMIRKDSSKKNIAFQMFKYHFEYLRGLRNYPVNRLGWTKRLLKRYFLCAYDDFRHLHVENNLKNEAQIRMFCANEMGYLINY